MNKALLTILLVCALVVGGSQAQWWAGNGLGYGNYYGSWGWPYYGYYGGWWGRRRRASDNGEFVDEGPRSIMPQGPRQVEPLRMGPKGPTAADHAPINFPGKKN